MFWRFRQVAGIEDRSQVIDSSVSTWLRSLQLAVYTDLFHAAGYATVHDLIDVNSAADLEHIGITSTTHQHLLLYSIDAIRQTINSTSTI